MAIKYFSPFRLADTVKGEFGTSGDLQIRHDSTNSEISNITGNLTIENKADDKDIIFVGDNQSGGTTTYFSLDGSTGYVKFEDNRKITIGSGNDLEFYHDGTNTAIDNRTGNLTINNGYNDGDIILSCDDGSGGETAYITLDGGLGYTTVQKNMVFADDVYARFGNQPDFEIGHDGSNSYISHTGVGNLIVKNTEDDGDVLLRCDDGSGGVATYLALDGGISSLIA